MTLIHSALAGGSWIDDRDRLCAGSTGSVLGHRVLAPSTLGTFLRSFSFGHARQLDAVSGRALQRAWRRLGMRGSAGERKREKQNDQSRKNPRHLDHLTVRTMVRAATRVYLIRRMSSGRRCRERRRFLQSRFV